MDLLYWFTPWEESFLVAATISAAALLYWRGCGRRHPSLRQKFYFWAGLILVYLVSHTQFDYYAEHQFFIHRLQHLVLHHLGPFLIILSSPLATLLAGMPSLGRQLCARIAGWKPFLYLVRILCNPIIAVALFSALIGFWLLPMSSAVMTVEEVPTMPLNSSARSKYTEWPACGTRTKRACGISALASLIGRTSPILSQ